MDLETWDVWYPNAASRGLSFARGEMEHSEWCWLHSAPDSVRIEVRDELGHTIARADQLRREGPELPMTLVTRRGDTLVREDRWPTDADHGMPVLLPGGEIGILREWWNAPDGSAWRWSVEFKNHR